MKTLAYKNFDDCIYNLPRQIVKQPEMYLDHTIATLGYIDSLILRFDSFDCVTDVSLLGYNSNKITKTVNDIFDEDRYIAFCNQLRNSTQSCCMYDFETRNFSKGGSIISVVLTRHDKRMKWKNCYVFFRTLELTRELAVYLVVLGKMLNNLPNCAINSIDLFIPQANISSYNICGCYEFYDIGVEETNAEHPFGNILLWTWKTYFSDDSKLSKYVALRNMQELRFGLKTFKPVTVDNIRFLENKYD